MKIFLALVLTVAASASYAGTGKLNIDISQSLGPSSHIEFNENAGVVTSNGSAPFAKTNVVYLKYNSDGSIQGFLFGTPIHLVCSATACDDLGSSQIHLAITQNNGVTTYEGLIRYHYVRATVSENEITVSSDGSFQAFKKKTDTFVGQGGFIVGDKVGAFDLKISTSGTLSVNDPKTVVWGILNTFTSH